MSEKKSGYKGFTEAQARANKRYLEKFAEVKVRMQPEERDALKAHAEAHNESVNGFINRAIKETIERDNAAQRPTSAPEGA